MCTHYTVLRRCPDLTPYHIRFCPTPHFLVVATANPPTIQTLHYALFTDELHDLEQDDTSELEQIVYLSDMSWIVDPDSPIVAVQYNPQLELYSLITADGRAYAVKELSGTSVKVSFRSSMSLVLHTEVSGSSRAPTGKGRISTLSLLFLRQSGTDSASMVA